MVFVGALHSMDKSSRQALYYLANKGDVPQKIYPLQKFKELPENCMTEEMARKQYHGELLCEEYDKCDVVQKQETGGSLWGWLFSSWGTKEDPSWKDPLIISDFEGNTGYAPRGRFIMLRGTYRSVLYDPKTKTKLFDHKEQEGTRVVGMIINAVETHAAVITKDTAYIYDLVKGGKPYEIPFGKSMRFARVGSSTHAVMLHENAILIYDLDKRDLPRAIQLSAPLTTWLWTGYENTNAFLVQLGETTAFCIVPEDNYRTYKIVCNDRFQALECINRYAVSNPDYFIFAQVDDELRLYDSCTGRQRYAGVIEKGDILEKYVAASYDNSRFAVLTTSCIRKGILLYHIREEKPVFIDLAGEERTFLSALQFSHDGAYFSYLLDGEDSKQEWFCHATKDGSLLKRVELPARVYGQPIWLPKSPFFVITRLEDAPIFVYDAEKQEHQFIDLLEARSSRDYFGRNYGSDVLTLALRNKEQEKEGVFYTIKGKEIIKKAFSTEEPFSMKGSCFNDQATLFAFAGDKKFFVYDVVSGRCVKSFDHPKDDRISRFNFSRQDKYFVANGTDLVTVFNPKDDYKPLNTLSFKENPIGDSMYASDKQYLILDTEKGLFVYYMHY